MAAALSSNRPNTAAGTETAAAAPNTVDAADLTSASPEAARARARLSVDSSGVLSSTASPSTSIPSSDNAEDQPSSPEVLKGTSSSATLYTSSGSVGALPSEAALVASGIVPARSDSRLNSSRSSTHSTAGSTAARLNALDELSEAQAQTLFPSPSGGFVPPPEMDAGQWKLKDAPAGTARSRASATAASASTPSETVERTKDPSNAVPSETPNRPPSLQPSSATASRIAGASNTSATASDRSSQITSPQRSPALRPNSNSASVPLPSIGPSNTSGTSKHASRSSINRGTAGGASERTLRSSQMESTRSREGAQRQSIQGKYSDSPMRHSTTSTASTTDRYSSGSAMGVPGVSAPRDTDVSASASTPSLPLKIRDFAFPVTDPRHVGARDVSIAGERLSSGYAGGENYVDDEEGEWHVEEEDEDDDQEYEGAAAGLAPGRYKAVYPFSAESAHELSVQTGDIVRVVGALEGGWAIADIVESVDNSVGEDGAPRRGLVPEAYLEWYASDDHVDEKTSEDTSSQLIQDTSAAAIKSTTPTSVSSDTIAVSS